MRIIAKAVGVLFIIAALWGFVDTGFGMDATMLLGLFPVNALHNVAHLVLGVWGYAASQSEQSAGRFARWGGVVYLVLAGIGFVSENPLDLMPMGGPDRFLHLGTGVLLLATGLFDAARPAVAHRSR